MNVSPRSVYSTDPMSDTLQSVLQLCLPYLELFQMVRLSSCSLQTASFCRSQLGIGNNMLAHALLHAAVTDAAELELAATGKGSRQKKQNAERQLKQFRRAVAWLVDAVGSKSLFSSVGTDDAAQTALIHLLIQRGTPVIHLELAERLVQSGLRVSYSELVLAARAGVSGIGVWPNTMQRSGVDTDIPAWAKYAALGTWEWSGTFVPIDSLSVRELTDFMFLVANGLPGSEDRIPRDRINMQLDQMVTILRHSAAHGVTANDIVGLMKLVSRYPGVDWEHGLQFHLCKLPEAAGVTAEQIVEPGNGLLDVGVRMWDGFLVECCLKRIPAGKDITPDVIIRCLKVLLEAAGHRIKVLDQANAERIPRLLVGSTQAERISPAEAAKLIHMGLGIRNRKVESFLEIILGLPSLRRLDASTRLALSRRASQMGMQQVGYFI